jgi:hypothetical protein
LDCPVLSYVPALHPIVVRAQRNRQQRELFIFNSQILNSWNAGRDDGTLKRLKIKLLCKRVETIDDSAFGVGALKQLTTLLGGAAVHRCDLSTYGIARL